MEPIVESHSAVGRPGPSRSRAGRRAAQVGALVLAWTVPAGLHTTMDVIMQHRLGRTIEPLLVFATTTAPWYIWLLATPLVLRMVRRRPLLRPLQASAVAWHVALWIGITIVYTGARIAARRAIGAPASAGGLLEQIVGWLPFLLLAYAAVAAVALAALFAGRAREQALERALLAEQLARAQLDALRMQLHPHFLFNALNTISMLVREHDADTAVRLIAELGALLRELLRRSPAAEMPLRHELDLLGRYLAIEQVRFGERLRVEHRIEPDALDAAVPPLVLQPLVENALRHGIARSTRVGVLSIEASRRDRVLVLTVRDNGPGIAPDATEGCGVGLPNTRERLRRLYGDDAYVRLAHDADGTIATIVLPYHAAGADAPSADAVRAPDAPYARPDARRRATRSPMVESTRD
jgi:signal transduction histidine kinase